MAAGRVSAAVPLLSLVVALGCAPDGGTDEGPPTPEPMEWTPPPDGIAMCQDGTERFSRTI